MLQGRTICPYSVETEMERDAGISHGASSFLRERLMLVSDKYQTAFCRVCGTFAVNENKPNLTYKRCRICQSESFGRCTIPYAYKLLIHYLGAAGINLHPEFMTSGEYYNRIFQRNDIVMNTDLNIITTELEEADQAIEEEQQEIQDEEIETNYDDIYE